jgi:hypothetical protein
MPQEILSKPILSSSPRGGRQCLDRIPDNISESTFNCGPRRRRRRRRECPDRIPAEIVYEKQILLDLVNFSVKSEEACSPS